MFVTVYMVFFMFVTVYMVVFYVCDRITLYVF